MNKQMDMLWKSSMNLDSAIGCKGCGGNHSDPETLAAGEVEGRDSVNWKGVIGKDDRSLACRWKPSDGMQRSTFTSGFGSVSIMGSKMTGLKNYN